MILAFIPLLELVRYSMVIIYFVYIFADFDANRRPEQTTSRKDAVSASASLAGISTLGLVRERMMRRHPKEQEEWMHAEERRRRGARSALSTAAGLSTFAAVSSINLPLQSERESGVYRPILPSSYTEASLNQNPLQNFGLNSQIANAVTSDEYYTESVSNSEAYNKFIEHEHNAVASTSGAGMQDIATGSTSIVTASEFSRGTFGIYDTKTYPKERVYSSVNSGFSPPLKESAPIKSRNFMFGGISLRNLKSKFTFAKEAPNELNMQKENQNLPAKTESISDEEIVTKKSTNFIAPVVPPLLQPDAISETSVIPDKIPLSLDDLPPVQRNANPQTSTIPDKIQLGPDASIEARKQTFSVSKPALKEAEKDVTNLSPQDTTMKAPNIHPNKDSTIPRWIFGDVSTTFQATPNGFYKTIATGSLAAAAARGFQGSSKRKRVIGASPQDVSFVASSAYDLNPRSYSVPPTSIETDKPFAYRSFNTDNKSSSQQSKFEIQTSSSHASSASETQPGKARVSLSMESTLTNDSSVAFTASSSSSGGVSFREKSATGVPSYRENAIDTTALGCGESYLDSLSRRVPSSRSSPGTGLQSYLEDISSRPMEINDYTSIIGNSMEQCGSSLDSVTQSLDSISIEAITPDMDFDSVYKDLNSATKDISSASAVLMQESFSGSVKNFNSPSNNELSVSSPASLSQETSHMQPGKGLATYLDDLASSSSLESDLMENDTSETSTYPVTDTRGSYLDSISQRTVAVCSGQGLASYQSQLSAAAPLSFNIPTSESKPRSISSKSIHVTNPAGDLVSEVIASSSRKARRVRVFVDSSVRVSRA